MSQYIAGIFMVIFWYSLSLYGWKVLI